MEILRLGIFALLCAGVLECLLCGIAVGIEQFIVDKLGLEDD